MEEILFFCSVKGILLDKEVLKILENTGDIKLSKNLLEKILFQFNQRVITKGFFIDNRYQLKDLLSFHQGDEREKIKKIFYELGVIDKDFNFLDEGISRDNIPIEVSCRVFQNTPKKIEVKDFVSNFKNRFNFLRNVLMERNRLNNLVSINRVSDKGNYSLIGMIFDKKTTKNGNILFEIEDLTGRINVLINKDKKEVYEKAKEVLLDEVVGLIVSGNREIVFVNDIIFPDVKILEKKRAFNEEFAAFISDIHVGSNKFLEKEFLKFIDWINGKVGDRFQRLEALKTKYLFIVGDSVDGVGVYPGQESQLILKDVNEQYEKLAEFLKNIRNDVNIILCPGQHDAVRVAEPQPIIGESFGFILKTIKNLYLVTNPAVIEIGKDVKFKILMYHGASMHGIINNIESLRLHKGHNSPTEVVKYMLKKRHLAPSHSLVSYTPLEGRDALIIDEVPDVVATGDLHRPEIGEYNGVMLIASSCWQARTPFEEKVGNNPDPCKVPILNLKTREVKILDFGEKN